MRFRGESCVHTTVGDICNILEASRCNDTYMIGIGLCGIVLQDAKLAREQRLLCMILILFDSSVILSMNQNNFKEQLMFP